jgi:general secretion pathway protein K
MVRAKLGWLMRSEQGVAMIIVLMVVTVLSVLILDLHESVRIQFYIASNLADGVKAEYLTRSGVQVAAGALLGDIQNNAEDHMHEDWANFMEKLGMPMMPAGDGNVMIDISDESGRFNLNALVDRRGNVRQDQVEIFKNLLTGEDLDPTLANGIVDWLDADSVAVDGGGAEDQTYGYSANPNGVLSKNGPFDSLQEVRLVHGITDEIWAKLEPLVTVYGDVKLNLNTADPKVMKAVLKYVDSNADPALIDSLAQWREQSGSADVQKNDSQQSQKDQPTFGFTSGEGNYFKQKDMSQILTGELNFDQQLARKFTKYFGVSSRFFRVTCTAIVNNVQKNALGVIFRTKKKVKIIYYRVAPGIAADLQKKIDQQNGLSTSPTPSSITGNQAAPGASSNPLSPLQ